MYITVWPFHLSVREMNEVYIVEKYVLKRYISYAFVTIVD